VVASAAAGVKDSTHRDVCTDEQVIGAGSASAQDPPVQVEASPARRAGALNIVLVSGCAGTVDRDKVYRLPTECLQDVSSSILVSHIFVACYFAFNSRLSLR
jgi:hypothetical protein